ncbi:MAG TPA: diaminopimelate decarboxylase [Thermoanaerobaculia bacterium]|nr:diaminopimelate decarboxylase [Thermoanaerobaculia bacterium]
MAGFSWRGGTLHADEVALPALAEAVGTPTYVYSAPAIRDAYRRLTAALASLVPGIRYAVKASPNVHLCRLLRELGAGMDVVSGGELERAWLAGTPMAEIVFAGAGKTDGEIAAALDGKLSPLRPVAARFAAADPADRGPVGLFNVESQSELARIAAVGADLGVRARVCLRVNPHVDPHTHEYITTGREENKFGIDADRIVGLFEQYADDPGVAPVGLHVHIGSQVSRPAAYAEAVAVVLTLVDDLAARGHRVEVVNVGGGWPVPYGQQEVPALEAFAERVVALLAPRVREGLQVLVEPGRTLVAEAGVLLIRVQHVKHGRARTFVICDGGMHSLIRPALYGAFHFIWPVRWHGAPPPRVESPDLPGLAPCDIVGPVCESGDFLAKGRHLPPVARGDLLAVFTAGAYGMSMASNYNDHGRPAEVLVDGERARVINERQPLAVLLETERLPREIRAGARAVEG